jgi:hypothetical protein
VWVIWCRERFQPPMRVARPFPTISETAPNTTYNPCPLSFTQIVERLIYLKPLLFE